MNNTKWNFIASNVQCLQITIEEIEKKIPNHNFNNFSGNIFKKY